jgi:signal peptidase II
MTLGQSIPILGNFFKLTYVENPGMAFGVRISNPILFMGLSIIAAIMVFYYLYRFRNHAWPIQIALSFITAGAIGNLMDRFIYGKVIDFLDFEFFDITIPKFSVLGMQFSGYAMDRWPVFNMADTAVSTGMIMVFIYLIVYGDPLKSSNSLQSAPKHEASG